MGGQSADAAKTLASAIELNTDLPEVFAYYGMALMRSGDLAGAEKAFRLEIVRDPGNYEANLNLGELLAKQGKPDEAVPLLMKAREIRPHDARAQLEAGKAHLSEGQLGEALAELQSAIRENPQSAETHQALAPSYDRLKRPADRDREQDIVQRIQEQAASNPAIEKLHREIMERLKAATKVSGAPGS